MLKTVSTQSPISNIFLKVSIEGHFKSEMVPKTLLHMFVLELHNIMVSPPEEDSLKEEKDSKNNIIISESILRKILSFLLNKMYARYKFTCGCECCISTRSIHSYLLSCQFRYLEKN